LTRFTNHKCLVLTIVVSQTSSKPSIGIVVCRWMRTVHIHPISKFRDIDRQWLDWKDRRLGGVCRRFRSVANDVHDDLEDWPDQRCRMSIFLNAGKEEPNPMSRTLRCYELEVLYDTDILSNLTTERFSSVRSLSSQCLLVKIIFFLLL